MKIIPEPDGCYIDIYVPMAGPKARMMSERMMDNFREPIQTWYPAKDMDYARGDAIYWGICEEAPVLIDGYFIDELSEGDNLKSIREFIEEYKNKKLSVKTIKEALVTTPKITQMAACLICGADVYTRPGMDMYPEECPKCLDKLMAAEED